MTTSSALALLTLLGPAVPPSLELRGCAGEGIDRPALERMLEGWVQDSSLVIVDAAHLIPWSESQNDHPTNGLALCKNHHWCNVPPGLKTFPTGLKTFCDRYPLRTPILRFRARPLPGICKRAA